MDDHAWVSNETLSLLHCSYRGYVMAVTPLPSSQPQMCVSLAISQSVSQPVSSFSRVKSGPVSNPINQNSLE